MKKIYSLLLFLVSITAYAQSNVGLTGNVGGVYINEMHYDNIGGDTGEFIEVAGPAGIDLSTYTLTLYNGNSGGVVYNTIALSGIIDNEGSGVGAIVFTFPSNGIQNGNPDGLALSNVGTDIQLLSYEGTFAAVGGAADGLTSVDIGVADSNATTAVGASLEYDETSMVWVTKTDDTPGDFVQDPTLGIEDNQTILFSIYPNPTSTGFVNIKTSISGDIFVSVFDVLGKQVINQELKNERLDISNLNTGVYIMKISQDNNIVTKKLIIK